MKNWLTMMYKVFYDSIRAADIYCKYIGWWTSVYWWYEKSKIFDWLDWTEKIEWTKQNKNTKGDRYETLTVETTVIGI
jgi:hypothetical protein